MIARGLISEAGTDVDSGAVMYRTTELFLERLGLASLGELPDLAPLLPDVDVIDALGDEMEDPFGQETNDLPLDALVRTVERELLAAVGRTDLPPPLLPKDAVLL